MNSVRRMIAAVAVPLVLTGCADDGAERPNALVRDSAGITIVEHDSATTHLPVWNVVDTALVVIGELDGPPGYILERVAKAHLLRDGRIVIVDAGARTLLFYDERGRHVGSVGRQGAGPGEFEGIRSAFVGPGDSIHVWDSQLGRLSVITPGGEFARSVQLTASEPMGSVTPQGALPAGRTLVAAMIGEVHPPGTESFIARDTMHVWTFSSDGAPVDSIGTWPFADFYRSFHGDGMIGGPAIFGRSTTLAVVDGRIVVADNERWELQVYDASGSLERVIRREVRNRPVTPADVDRYRSGADDPGIPERFRERIRDHPMPETMPAFDDVVAGDSTVWLAEYRPGWEEGARRWLVVDPGEGLLARASTPPGFELHHASGDVVVGVRTDDLGVQQVVLLPIQKAAP